MRQGHPIPSRRTRRSSPWLGLLLLGLRLALPFAAHAEAPRLSVRLATEIDPALSQRLLSALNAQLSDLAIIDVRGRAPEAALGIVSITQAGGALSIRFADAEAREISAPRSVANDAAELSASEVASIVRAFVVARLDQRSAQGSRQGPQAEQARAKERLADVPKAPRLSPEETPSEASGKMPEKAEARRPPARPAEPRPASKSPEEARETTRTKASPARRSVAVTDRPGSREDPSGRLRLALLYTGQWYAPQLPWRHGVRVDASARLTRWLYVGASYAYQLPATVRGEGAEVRVAAHAPSTFVGVGRDFTRFGAAFDLGLGAEKVQRSTTQVADMLQRTPDRAHWNLLGVLRLHGRIRFPRAPRLALEVAPALELAPGVRGARAELPDGAESVILSPGWVRGRIDLGATLEVL